MDLVVIPKILCKKGGVAVKRMIPMLLMVALLLSGCGGWLDASYHNVTPFEPEGNYADAQTPTYRFWYRKIPERLGISTKKII